MTILLDSSVLIHAQRLPNSDITAHLGEILASGEAVVTGPVIMEFIRGAKSQEQIDRFTRTVVSIDFLETDQAVWVVAGRLGIQLMRKGLGLPANDIIVAATAIRHDVPLYTLDKGFNRIAELKLYQPSLA